MGGDYISREAVLAQKGDCYDKDGHLLYAVGTGNILRIPAADVVEVRHGRWEWDVLDGTPGYRPVVLCCSNCHRVSFSGWAYCPNCGAKMDDNVIQHTESVGNALGALDEVEELSRYIDANKMADELSKVPWYKREDEKQAVRMVKEFPTADVVEVVHASWVWNPDGMDWGIGAWVCGKCKSRPETWWNTVKECHPLRCSGSHYCGNCGAKMDGGQDDV